MHIQLIHCLLLLLTAFSKTQKMQITDTSTLHVPECIGSAEVDIKL